MGTIVHRIEAVKTAKVSVEKYDGISSIINKASVRIGIGTNPEWRDDVASIDLTSAQAYELWRQLGRLRVVKDQAEDAAIRLHNRKVQAMNRRPTRRSR